MNYYTIYWLNGDRSVVFGDTIEDAFTHAGYGGGAVKAIDWYDEGVSETHWYDKEIKKWIPYNEIKIHGDDIKNYNPIDIINFLNKFDTVIVEYKSKDQLVFKQQWGLFYLNNIKKSAYVKHINVAFAEYFKGTYGGDSDNEENEHHFMMAGTQYFAPENVAMAAQVFLERAINEPFNSKSGSESMEDIHSKQKIKYEG